MIRADIIFKSIAKALKDAPELSMHLFSSAMISVFSFGIMVVFLTWLIGITGGFIFLPWVEMAIGLLGPLAVLIMVIVLFPAVVTTISMLRAEKLLLAVEARHYSDLPPPRQQSMIEILKVTGRFLGLAFLLNILILPLYLIPLGNIAIFLGLNGYLLAREYFEVIALRRMDPAKAKSFFKSYRKNFILAGAIIAALLSIPLLNLFVPALAVIFMLHVFEAIHSEDKSATRTTTLGAENHDARTDLSAFSSR